MNVLNIMQKTQIINIYKNTYISDINVTYTKDLHSIHFIKTLASSSSCNQQGLRVDIKGDINCASDKLLTRMTSQATLISIACYVYFKICQWELYMGYYPEDVCMQYFCTKCTVNFICLPFKSFNNLI